MPTTTVGENPHNTANMGTVGGMLSASREKYWKELSLEEKTERLRGEAKRLQNDNDDLRGKLYKLEILANEHTQDTFGRILVPAANVKESTYKRIKLNDKGGDEVYL